MAQNDLLLPWASVIENITLGQRLRKEKLDINKAHILLEKVGFDPLLFKDLPPPLNLGVSNSKKLGFISSINLLGSELINCPQVNLEDAYESVHADFALVIAT